MDYVEFPKSLYGPQGWDNLDDMVIVENADEEADERKIGYSMLSDNNTSTNTTTTTKSK